MKKAEVATKTTATPDLPTRAHPTIAEKRQVFRSLHANGCFVMPNPWDVGTARYLQSLAQFKALATTSAGAAFSLGFADGNGMMTRDDMLTHIRTLVETTDVPVNADFQNGYGKTLDDLAANVKLCVETGVAGLSIEDATGDAKERLYSFDLAVERVRTARAAITKTGADVMFTARCECFLVGQPDLNEVIRRLTAYAAAGADCLYAPGLRSVEHISAVVKAVSPKPVNFLASVDGLTVPQLAALGVRRVSVGSALARTAWGAFMRAARTIAERGEFTAFRDAVPMSEIDNFFARDIAQRKTTA